MREKQFFINLKDEEIPWDKSDPRYSAFWENEKKKVKDGIEIEEVLENDEFTIMDEIVFEHEEESN